MHECEYVRVRVCVWCATTEWTGSDERAFQLFPPISYKSPSLCVVPVVRRYPIPIQAVGNALVTPPACECLWTAVATTSLMARLLVYFSKIL
ncbi:hypothetical protein EVAR_65301_1 [Eumeta japonica]|uniref:Uncharacterized protein n=1 Tax=Eumeta variegata TaxID=151549 RepID=A0A4C1YV39_EUMVA|nr:hypothetical protein EVAR_65301_1 [Eumeta japonica]